MTSIEPCFGGGAKAYRQQMAGHSEATALPAPSGPTGIAQWDDQIQALNASQEAIRQAIEIAGTGYQGEAGAAGAETLKRVESLVGDCRQPAEQIRGLIETADQNQHKQFRALPVDGEPLPDGTSARLTAEPRGTWESNGVLNWLNRGADNEQQRMEAVRKTDAEAERVIAEGEGRQQTVVTGLGGVAFPEPPPTPAQQPPPAPDRDATESDVDTTDRATLASTGSSDSSVSAADAASSHAASAAPPVSNAVHNVPAGPPAGTISSNAPGQAPVTPAPIVGSDGKLYGRNPYNGNFFPVSQSSSSGSGGKTSGGSSSGGGRVSSGGGTTGGSTPPGQGGRASTGGPTPAGTTPTSSSTPSASPRGSAVPPGAVPPGGANRGQDEEQERDTPSWLVRSRDEEFIGDPQLSAPPAFGDWQNQRNQHTQHHEQNRQQGS